MGLGLGLGATHPWGLEGVHSWTRVRTRPFLPSRTHTVLLHVNVQAVLLSKSGVTLVAFVGLLPCVQPLVDLEVVGHREALPALVANKRADAGM